MQEVMAALIRARRPELRDAHVPGIQRADQPPNAAALAGSVPALKDHAQRRSELAAGDQPPELPAAVRAACPGLQGCAARCHSQTSSSRRPASSNEATAHILPVVCEPHCHRSQGARARPGAGESGCAPSSSIGLPGDRTVKTQAATEAEALTDARRCADLGPLDADQPRRTRGATAAQVPGAVVVTRPIRRVRRPPTQVPQHFRRGVRGVSRGAGCLGGPSAPTRPRHPLERAL